MNILTYKFLLFMILYSKFMELSMQCVCFAIFHLKFNSLAFASVAFCLCYEKVFCVCVFGSMCGDGECVIK